MLRDCMSELLTVAHLADAVVELTGRRVPWWVHVRMHADILGRVAESVVAHIATENKQVARLEIDDHPLAS